MELFIIVGGDYCYRNLLKARCVCGETSIQSGPNGLQPATHLTQCLRDLGMELYRFKTGTPARLDGKSIDFSKMIRAAEGILILFLFLLEHLDNHYIENRFLVG